MLSGEIFSVAARPGEPIILPPGQIRQIGTPRLDAVTLFKQFWDARAPMYGVKPLPIVPISEICRFDEPIYILEPGFRPGNVSALELIVLNHLVRHRRPRTCFEIGTFDGRSALNICANAASQAHVFTLDLPRGAINDTKHKVESSERQFIEKDGSGTRFLGTAYSSRIEQLYGDSAQFDFTAYEGLIDFVFVDASHAKENVLADAQTAANLLRRNTDGRAVGCVLFHDYGVWEGVTEALEELAATDPSYAGLKKIGETSFALLDL